MNKQDLEHSFLQRLKGSWQQHDLTQAKALFNSLLTEQVAKKKRNTSQQGTLTLHIKRQAVVKELPNGKLMRLAGDALGLSLSLLEGERVLMMNRIPFKCLIPSDLVKETAQFAEYTEMNIGTRQDLWGKEYRPKWDF